jgi:hypothetical protein
MTNYPYATSASIKNCTITTPQGTNTKDITDLVMRFDYFENIDYPSTHAKLQLQDSGANIISSYPIQGFEKIVLTFEVGEDNEFEYEFRINKIENRFEGQRFQTYTLILLPKEALVNESIKIASTFSDKPESVVAQMLEKIGTEKRLLADPTLFNIKFHVPKKSPFSVIDFVRTRSVYGQSRNSSADSSSKPKFSSSSSASSTPSDLEGVNSSTYNKTGGTAGYLFFENRSGYNFKSMETLFSVEAAPAVASYYLQPKDVGVTADKKILDVEFPSEIDMITKLRMGAFSSVLCTYDFSTGKYEETVYSLASSYKELTHLGTQSGLPSGQKELSNYPTRVMSVLTDHETWGEDAKIGSPDAEDGGSGEGQYPDFQKHYIMQTIARSHTATNQKLNLKLPINPSLQVGDKITVYLPNQIPSADRTEDPYDKEHSGTYLISELNHVFSPKKTEALTFVTVIRDTYGMEDTSSNVK